jgi:hypothetical protein
VHPKRGVSHAKEHPGPKDIGQKKQGSVLGKASLKYDLSGRTTLIFSRSHPWGESSLYRWSWMCVSVATYTPANHDWHPPSAPSSFRMDKHTNAALTTTSMYHSLTGFSQSEERGIDKDDRHWSDVCKIPATDGPRCRTVSFAGLSSHVSQDRAQTQRRKR